MKWLAWRELHSVYGGLFCGTADVESSVKSLFQRTDLYHLLVVSGAHLVFLEQILHRLLPKREKTKLAVFFVFTIVCQLNPPICRALFGQLCQMLSVRKGLFLSADARILVSGLWCLILFPEWILSYSLLLSWMASLAFLHPTKGWKKHFIIALYLLPWTQSLRLSGVFNNMIFGFFFETLIFPLSALFFLVPGLTLFGNFLWTWTLWGVEWLPSNPPTTPALDHLPYWVFIFVLHLVHRKKK